MATWVVWGVTNWQRKMDAYAEAQARCVTSSEGQELHLLHQCTPGPRLLHLSVMAVAEGVGPAGLKSQIVNTQQLTLIDIK
jgi:hypothetical protein